MNVLCVIDMQPQFSASRSKALQRRVLVAIAHAKKNGWKILNVKYSGFGPVAPALKRALTGEQVVWKHDDDGSKEIKKALGRAKVDNFYLTGVNSTCCVASTAQGLGHLYRNTEIFITAAVGDDDVYWDYGKCGRILIGNNQMAAQDAGGHNVKAIPMFRSGKKGQ